MMPTIPATNGHHGWSTPGTSRAINVTMLRAEVEVLCKKQQTVISAIESLPRERYASRDDEQRRRRQNASCVRQDDHRW